MLNIVRYLLLGAMFGLFLASKDDRIGLIGAATVVVFVLADLYSMRGKPAKK